MYNFLGFAELVLLMDFLISPRHTSLTHDRRRRSRRSQKKKKNKCLLKDTFIIFILLESHVSSRSLFIVMVVNIEFFCRRLSEIVCLIGGGLTGFLFCHV